MLSFYGLHQMNRNEQQALMLDSENHKIKNTLKKVEDVEKGHKDTLANCENTINQLESHMRLQGSYMSKAHTIAKNSLISLGRENRKAKNANSITLSTMRELRDAQLEMQKIHGELIEKSILADSQKGEVERLNNELNTQKKEVEQLRAALESSTSTDSKNDEELKKANALIESQRKEVERLDRELDEQKQEVKRLGTALDSKDADIKKANDLAESKSSELKQLNSKLGAKDEELKKANALAESKSEELKQLHADLESKDDKLKKANDLVESKSEELKRLGTALDPNASLDSKAEELKKANDLIESQRKKLERLDAELRSSDRRFRQITTQNINLKRTTDQLIENTLSQQNKTPKDSKTTAQISDEHRQILLSMKDTIGKGEKIDANQFVAGMPYGGMYGGGVFGESGMLNLKNGTTLNCTQVDCTPTLLIGQISNEQHKPQQKDDAADLSSIYILAATVLAAITAVSALLATCIQRQYYTSTETQDYNNNYHLSNVELSTGKMEEVEQVEQHDLNNNRASDEISEASAGALQHDHVRYVI